MSALVWFRNDLRLDDHVPLRRALDCADSIVPVYCFDPRQFATTSFGFAKTGSYRARFLLQSVADLRSSLRALGSELIVRQGLPEELLPELAQASGATGIHYHAEVTAEELSVERALARALEGRDVDLRPFHGTTLLHPEDLPFEVRQTPAVFTRFRQQVEKLSTPRPAIGGPSRMPIVDVARPGELPTLASLGLAEPTHDERGVLAFQGGESAGRARLEEYVWEGDHLRRYKHTRNEMLGADYSSKLSPWLAAGCLSPRRIHDEVKRYERLRVCNESTYWLVFELLWRDYFRLICAKHGRRVFRRSGIRGLQLPWSRDEELFRCWQAGQTGYPLVDANMRELAATGFLSNRGRQIVASFLTKNLGVDWRMGAEWFESLLIDYDVCSNWGNWNYAAGVGNDARGFRYFNVAKQARDYDAEGRYVKHWLPELRGIAASKVHEPWRLGEHELLQSGVRLGQDYPRPVVDFWDSIRSHEEAYAAASR